MNHARPPRGSEAHTSAVDRLAAAREERSRLQKAADDARGRPSEEAAQDEAQAATDRVSGRETWLTWVERGF